MKKNYIKICLLALILLIISLTVILLMGRTYTARFKLKSENYKMTLENLTGEAEIIDEEIRNDEYIIKIKGQKEGKVDLILSYGELAEQKILFIHKSKIITYNNFFGYSKGSEIIPISLSILLIYVLVLLIKKYRISMKDNIFQYRNVAYLGMIIFLLSITINNVLSIFRYQGIDDTIDKTIRSMSILSYFLFPIALVTFLLIAISNIQLMRKEGVSIRNVLGLLLGIFICALTILPENLYKILNNSTIIDIHNLNSVGPYLYNFVESLVYLIVAYLECVLIGTIVVATKSVKRKIPFNKDYMLILGCQIHKDGTLTPLLKGRVDSALKFRNEQLKETGKDLIFVPSGGKGPDEIMPEAEAMKKYLLENGIKEEHIITETKSKNTEENIKFSNKLINNKKANIAFSTTNYHVFRAGLLATEQGLKFDGIGSKTKSYFWINAFIREFIGSLYSERKKHMLVFLLIIVMIIIMISITYLANNI